MKKFEPCFIPARKRLAICLLGVTALSTIAPQVFAAQSVGLGSAAEFSVLSAAPLGGGAVTCTDSVVLGNVGSSGAAPAVVQTNCYIDGAIVAPVSATVLTDFSDAYYALAGQVCDEYLTTLAGQTLNPGTYCFEAASTTTGGVLTLNGNANDSWLFKVGTLGTGALTTTDFDVVMANNAEACDVTWWVAQAATVTRGDFKGNIFAGDAITVTGAAPTTAFEGRTMAGAAVTLTNSSFLGCVGDVVGGDGDGEDNGHGDQKRDACNQGVGNGPEGCDPGRSNHGDDANSNDELGGKPGQPGRKGH